VETFKKQLEKTKEDGITEKMVNDLVSTGMGRGGAMQSRFINNNV
jgi:hypothetical protein